MQEYWSGKLFSSLGDLPDAGIKPGSSASQADSSLWYTGEAPEVKTILYCCSSVTHSRPTATVGPQHTRFLCTSLTPRLPLTLQLMSIDLVMPSNHLVLCHPLLLLPSIFPSMRVFSNELALRIRWSEYWSFSFRISPSNEYSGFIWIALSKMVLSLLVWKLPSVWFSTLNLIVSRK